MICVLYMILSEKCVVSTTMPCKLGILSLFIKRMVSRTRKQLQYALEEAEVGDGT